MSGLMSRPRQTLLFAVVVSALLGCVQVRASEKQAVTHVPGTRIGMVVPAGFEQAAQFPGFQQDSTGSSIMIIEMPASFEDIRVGLAEEGLASQGMTLLSSKNARIAERDGLLIAASQEANGITYRKWIGVFGSDSTAVMVVATFPEDFATEMDDLMKQCVMSAEWNPSADVGLFDGLRFRVQETATLKVSRRMSNMLVLTKGGQPGPVPPSEPLLIVGSSISEVEIDDIEAFAKMRLTQTAGVKEISDIRGTSMTLGGVPGYEVTAAAKDSDSGAPIALYQAIGVVGESYYILQGLVGAAGADQYMAEFRKVAASMSFVE